MEAARRQAENKIAELRERMRCTLDRFEQSLVRRELMVELAMLQELVEQGYGQRTASAQVAHLRGMAERCRSLARATLDRETLRILNEIGRDYDDEAKAAERREANDGVGT